MTEKEKECHRASPKRKGGGSGAHKVGSCSRTAATEKGAVRAGDDNDGGDYCQIFRPACVGGQVPTKRLTHVVLAAGWFYLEITRARTFIITNRTTPASLFRTLNQHNSYPIVTNVNNKQTK